VKSNEALLSPHMSEENNSQVFAPQMFHSQMQNQECKIEAIEKHSKAVGKMMKKQLESKKEKVKKEVKDEPENEDRARAGTWSSQMSIMFVGL